ncbi:hypothetical protein MKJ01_10630 [Chryseobacterium sp. SSA4.19]|uniref:hypothetical protein n=1 Tax=Chryseobacterium sp. SSA4.19 TaxID=2919915 RepID=UPI001F4E9825|nr:hypothetical protein [Chryseobacterium sp. SSA4.19]MCJ8154214.1 hypothetical protein [Chryseobacterium sp. SSA4.19]
MITQQQTTAAIFGIPSLLMVIALAGNHFVTGWDWSGSDFLIAGILLFGTASLIYWIGRFTKTFKTKLIISLIVLAALVLVWAELAVGIFGTSFSGN